MMARPFRASLPSGHEAVRKGRMAELAALSDEQRVAVLNAKDQNGWLPAHVAARNGNLEALRFISTHAPGLMAKTSNGLTLAHLAARGGFVDVLRYLTQYHGLAVLKATDDDGWTPAHSAARGGHIKALQYILDQLDASEESVGTFEPSLEHVATTYRQTHVLRFLRDEDLADSLSTSSMSDSDEDTGSHCMGDGSGGF